MKTIDEKLQDSQHRKEAQKTLDDFEETMVLVRQYPIKPTGMLRPQYPPYTLPQD